MTHTPNRAFAFPEAAFRYGQGRVRLPPSGFALFGTLGCASMSLSAEAGLLGCRICGLVLKP